MIDYTRTQNRSWQPSPLHCHIQNLHSALKNYGSNIEQHNILAEHEHHLWWEYKQGFDGYAPTYYGPSYGIYKEQRMIQLTGKQVEMQFAEGV